MSRKNDQIHEWALKSATCHMKDELSERALFNLEKTIAVCGNDLPGV